MRVLVLASVLVLVLGGCQKVVRKPDWGGAPEHGAPADTVTSPSPPRTPAPRVEPFQTGSDRSVRLGVLAPLSGRYAAYGRAYLDGATLAVETFNQSRPGDTAPVELVPADSKGEPLPALTGARRLMGMDRLIAILGSVLSLPTLTAAIEANCKGVPFLSNVATEEGIGRVGPYTFQHVLSRQSGARSAAEVSAFALRCFRAAILYPESADGRSLASSFGERLSELGGELVFQEAYGVGSTDFVPVLRRISATEPDVLYIPAGVEDMLLIAPALGFQGLRAQLIGTEDWGSDRLLDSVGLDLEGALLPGDPLGGSGQEFERFQVLYRTRFSEDGNRFAAAGFLGARSILDVVASLEAPDRDSVRAALEERLGQEDLRQSRRFFVVRSGQPAPFSPP